MCTYQSLARHVELFVVVLEFSPVQVVLERYYVYEVLIFVKAVKPYRTILC